MRDGGDGLKCVYEYLVSFATEEPGRLPLRGFYGAASARKARGETLFHAVSLLRVIIRFVYLACGIVMLVSTYVGLAGGSDKPWTGFIRGWSIVLIVIEGLMALYALWKNAWIKENPERYLTPVYPLTKKTTSSRKVQPQEKKKETPNPKTIAQDNAIEVEVKEAETPKLPPQKK